MRITLNNTEYKQLNTNEENFVLQNLGNYVAFVVKASAKPANDAQPDILLNPYDGINNNIVTGKFWGKSSVDSTIDIGLLEE